MRRNEWADWWLMAETFVSERSVEHPNLTIAAVSVVLDPVPSWADFVGGEWIPFAEFELELSDDCPGFGDERLYRTIERLTGWLYERGDVSSWTRDVFSSAVSGAREAQIPGVRECVLHESNREELVEHFARSTGTELSWANTMVDYVGRSLGRQLGPGRGLPLGALAAGRCVDDFLIELNGSLWTQRVIGGVLALAARFYAWLADVDLLDATRSRAIAREFARGAIGLRAESVFA